MTASELMSHFNRIYGMDKRPQTYEVDSDTYANCCQFLLDRAEIDNESTVLRTGIGDLSRRMLYVGIHNGLMFKGVELILQK